MKRNKPRISIGMPVFNGEKYIKEAINSILSQTYQDFELIISDNASTDNTQKICLDYAKRDNRVSYYRNEKNLGGPNNYNCTFELSSAEYFKWAAYDDLLAPEFLKKCINVLDSDSSVAGCICKTGRIDQNGNLLGYFNEGLLKRIGSQKTHERFRDSLNLYYTTTPFHGLYRKSIFAKSQRHGSYIGADRNLVAELSLMGRIFEIPECLFFWRIHPDSYTSRFYSDTKEDTIDNLLIESAWWSKKTSTYFPHWKNCVEYFKSVNRVKLSLFERLLCYNQIFGWFIVEGYRFMGKDIILFMLHNSVFSRKIIQKLPSALRHSLILFSRK